MPELLIAHLEAIGKTLVSLVEGLSAQAPRAERGAVSEQLIHELLLKYWRGIPGHPRGGATVPSPTDLNALVILSAIMQHTRRPIVLGL